MKLLDLHDFKYILVVGTTEYELTNAPTGWQDESLIYFRRDAKYHSLFRSFTLPMVFPREGATILRTQYYQYGSEALVRFKVKQLNRDTFQYEDLFIGELDFSTAIDTRDTFECNVMSGGLERYIKAYENVQYEIPIGNDAVNVIVPGIGISEYANSVTEAGVLANCYPAINLVNNNLPSGLMTARNTTRDVTVSPNPDNWAFRCNNPDWMPVRIYGRFTGTTIPSSGTRQIRLVQLDDTGQSSVIYPIIFNASGSFDVTFDYNRTLKNNYRLYFDVRGGDIQLNSSEVNVSFVADLPDFTVKGYPVVTLLEKLLFEIYDNNQVTVNSYLLRNTRWANLILSSGDGIRGLENATIKLSLREFMQSIDSLLCASFGIGDNSFTVEARESSYNNVSDVVTLGEVKDLKLETYTDGLYTDINVGYENQDYDKEDGRDEFNSSQNWKLPINRITSKPLDLISKFRADSRGVEQIRIDLMSSNKKTTDSKSDNDVFMFMCYRDGSNYRPITSTGFTSVSGVIAPTKTYNYDISPKQNLLRHQGVLKSMLNNLDGTRIIFASSDKNAELETISLSGFRVKENENIDVDSLTGQLFIPITAIFTTKYPRNIQELIKSNPYGQISFLFNGYRFRGFILEVGSDVSRNSEREFKLLLSVNNNLVNLIR